MAASPSERLNFADTLPIVRNPQETLEKFPDILYIEGLFSDQLENGIRYDRYRTNETTEEWIELLGPDVRARTHPHEAARHVHNLITTQEAHGNPLGNTMKTMLYVTPFPHDWGELIVEGEGIGDINYEKKTAEHERQERAVFQRITDLVPSATERGFFRATYDEVVSDRVSPLGKLFNIVERVGYVETAINAYLGNRGQRIENWSGLSGNVLALQIPALLNVREHPYVDLFLAENETIINHMYGDIQSQPVQFDREGTLSYIPDILMQSQTMWNNR